MKIKKKSSSKLDTNNTSMNNNNDPNNKPTKTKKSKKKKKVSASAAASTTNNLSSEVEAAAAGSVAAAAGGKDNNEYYHHHHEEDSGDPAAAAGASSAASPSRAGSGGGGGNNSNNSIFRNTGGPSTPLRQLQVSDAAHLSMMGPPLSSTRSPWLRSTGSFNIESLFSPPRNSPSKQQSLKHPLMFSTMEPTPTRPHQQEEGQRQQKRMNQQHQQDRDGDDPFVAPDLEGDDDFMGDALGWTGSFTEEVGEEGVAGTPPRGGVNDDDRSSFPSRSPNPRSPPRNLMPSFASLPRPTYNNNNNNYLQQQEQPQNNKAAAAASSSAGRSSRQYTFGYQPAPYTLGMGYNNNNGAASTTAGGESHQDGASERDELMKHPMETPTKKKQPSSSMPFMSPPSSVKYGSSPFPHATPGFGNCGGSFGTLTPGGMLGPEEYSPMPPSFDDSFVRDGPFDSNLDFGHEDGEGGGRARGSLPPPPASPSLEFMASSFSPLEPGAQPPRSNMKRPPAASPVVPSKSSAPRSRGGPSTSLKSTTPRQLQQRQGRTSTSPVQPRRKLYPDSKPTTGARGGGGTGATMRVELGRQSSATQRILEGINSKMQQRAPALQAPTLAMRPPRQKPQPQVPMHPPHHASPPMQHMPPQFASTTAHMPYHPYQHMMAAHHHRHQQQQQQQQLHHHHHRAPPPPPAPPIQVAPERPPPVQMPLRVPIPPPPGPVPPARRTARIPLPEKLPVVKKRTAPIPTASSAQSNNNNKKDKPTTSAPAKKEGGKENAAAETPSSSISNKNNSTTANNNNNNNKKKQPPPSDAPKRAPCNCKKSKCLKLYCECFSSEVFCEGCNCADCNNTPEYAGVRDKAMKDVRSKNPQAFKQRISNSHNVGCRCKRSECLKKYCECFQARVLCSSKCKCSGCMNQAGSQKLIDKRRKMKDSVGAEFAMREAEKSWKAQAPQRKQQGIPPRRMPGMQTPSQGRGGPFPPIRPAASHNGPHRYPAVHGAPPPHFMPYMGQARHPGYSPMGKYPPITPYTGTRADDRSSFPPPPAPVLPRTSSSVKKAPPTTAAAATTTTTTKQEELDETDSKVSLPQISPTDSKASQKAPSPEKRDSPTDKPKPSPIIKQEESKQPIPDTPVIRASASDLVIKETHPLFAHTATKTDAEDGPKSDSVSGGAAVKQENTEESSTSHTPADSQVESQSVKQEDSSVTTIATEESRLIKAEPRLSSSEITPVDKVPRKKQKVEMAQQ